MLIDISLEKTPYANHILEAREHWLLLEHVVMRDPAGPGRDEEEQIGHVVWIVHVRRLQVDAVQAAEHGVVGEGHLVGDVDGWVGALCC